MIIICAYIWRIFLHMKKKTTVQSINKHSTPPSEETKIQKHEVPGLMTLSDSILSGAVVEYRKAGYSFARHLHTNIEIYRILSGECYMDIQSETIHCTEGEFIMLLPDVIHSFYLNDTSDCEFQHIHFNPEMFSTIVLEDEGVFPITLMHAILFSAQFYYRMESDPSSMNIFRSSLRSMLHPTVSSLLQILMLH